MFPNLVWVLAIGDVIWMMITTRYQLCTGRVVMLPLYSATLVFAVGILAGWLPGSSPGWLERRFRRWTA